MLFKVVCRVLFFFSGCVSRYFVARVVVVCCRSLSFTTYVSCVLCVMRCLWFVVCCLLFVVCWCVSPLVAYCLFFGKKYVWFRLFVFGVLTLLLVVCFGLCVVCCWLFVACWLSVIVRSLLTGCCLLCVQFIVCCLLLVY